MIDLKIIRKSPGWLSNLCREMREKRVFKNLKVVVAGVLEGAGLHPSNDGGEAISYAEIAQRNEFGYMEDNINIPERPFMRTACRKCRRKLVKEIQKNLNSYMLGNSGTAEVSTRLGEFLREQIKNSIWTWTDPANAAMTIRRKGFNDPLIETSYLWGVINWKQELEAPKTK